jgi:hypothetical protein
MYLNAKRIMSAYKDTDVRIEFCQRDGASGPAVGADASSAKLTLRYVERNCFFNALQNLDAMEKLSGEQLCIVAGSLGLCAPLPCWFEWGGTGSTPHATVAQFAKCPVTGLPDVHFWLESQNGKVFDVLDMYLTEKVAPFHHKTVDTGGLMHGVLVQGTSAELEERGLRYIPATPLVQTCLINLRLRRNNLID